LSRENGKYLVAERNSSQLSSAIEALIQRADWMPIARANRDLVESELDAKKQVARLSGIYRGLATGAVAAAQSLPDAVAALNG
jgi:hypothetical protein